MPETLRVARPLCRNRFTPVQNARDWPGGLARRPRPADNAGMKRALVTLSLCWLAFCGATRSNVLPLHYGMTPDEVTLALGVPLNYLSGRRGSEIYVAVGSALVPGYYPVETALALQFRHNRLTGWKQDWQLRRYPWPF
jgi:hypothetical protein